jgi:hypothetical protein
MEVIDRFLPLRGPPLLKMKRNTHFLNSWLQRCSLPKMRMQDCYSHSQQKRPKTSGLICVFHLYSNKAISRRKNTAYSPPPFATKTKT